MFVFILANVVKVIKTSRMRKKEKRKKEIKKNKKQHQLTLSNPNNAYMDIAIAM